MFDLAYYLFILLGSSTLLMHRSILYNNRVFENIMQLLLNYFMFHLHVCNISISK